MTEEVIPPIRVKAAGIKGGSSKKRGSKKRVVAASSNAKNGTKKGGDVGLEKENVENGGDESKPVWFLYKGQPIEEIPRDVTHLHSMHPSKLSPRMDLAAASNWWRWCFGEDL